MDWSCSTSSRWSDRWVDLVRDQEELGEASQMASTPLARNFDRRPLGSCSLSSTSRFPRCILMMCFTRSIYPGTFISRSSRRISPFALQLLLPNSLPRTFRRQQPKLLQLHHPHFHFPTHSTHLQRIYLNQTLRESRVASYLRPRNQREFGHRRRGDSSLDHPSRFERDLLGCMGTRSALEDGRWWLWVGRGLGVDWSDLGCKFSFDDETRSPSPRTLTTLVPRFDTPEY